MDLWISTQVDPLRGRAGNSGLQAGCWVASLRHNEREPSEFVEIFRTLRVLNLSVWRRMSPEDLQRSGQHTERGAESLAVMLQLLAGHDLSHLHQISRYVQALESRGYRRRDRMPSSRPLVLG